jgi:hypothetical protein
MREINYSDYLFILKNDNLETIDDIKKDLYIWDDKNCINLSWSDDCCFDNNDVVIANNFRRKLCYLFASCYEDTMLINIVKRLVPGVEDVRLPSHRYASGFNFKVWQKKYGFTIEEFLTNRKYIVISDSKRAVDNIMDLGLFNWDNIETCSLTDN